MANPLSNDPFIIVTEKKIKSSPLGKLFSKIKPPYSNFANRNVMAMAVVLMLVGGIGVGLYSLSNHTQLRPKAGGGGVEVSLSPNITTVAPNQTFQLKVNIDTKDQQVTAAQIKVKVNSYNTNNLTLNSVQIDNSFLPTILSQPQTTADGTTFTVASNPSAPKQGIGTLATLSFTASSCGQTSCIGDIYLDTAGTQVASISQNTNAVGNLVDSRIVVGNNLPQVPADAQLCTNGLPSIECSQGSQCQIITDNCGQDGGPVSGSCQNYGYCKQDNTLPSNGFHILHADPNPCILIGTAETCTSTISWSTNYNDLKITIKEAPGSLFASGANGSQAASWIRATGATFEAWHGDQKVDSLFVQGTQTSSTALQQPYYRLEVGPYNDSTYPVKVFARTDTDAVNLFVVKLNYGSNTNFVRFDNTGSVITNWATQTHDNTSISLAGGIPTPGIKTQGTDALITTLIFSKDLSTDLTTSQHNISFQSGTSMYRNSDNDDILISSLDLAGRKITYAPPSASQSPSPQPSASSSSNQGGKGDGNLDGTVNYQDLSVLLSNWTRVGVAKTVPPQIDFNDDGKINTFDFSSMTSLLVQLGIIHRNS